MNASSSGEVVVRLRGVSKRFVSHGNVYEALTDVNLEARAGGLTLLLGPSGSGKTTLLTIAAGFVAPTSGTVELFGVRLEQYGDGRLQRMRASRMGFIFQTFLLIDALTVSENIELQLRFSGMRGAEVRRRAHEALVRVGIAHLSGKRPAELSHGERQRAAIARSLATEAGLLLADEPTASLDTRQGEAIIRLLHSCAVDAHACVIVASHDTRLRAYADAIHRLDNGRLAPNSGGDA